MTPTQSGKAHANDIEIYYEAFGNEQHPAILLTMGLDAQLLLWPDTLIDALVEAGYYVIRYDNRDIGWSTWFNDTWKRSEPYTLEDMARDAIGLLDFLSIRQVHLIGVSMGGMISQRLAISYPDRVLTLTSIMSSGYMLNPATQSTISGKFTTMFTPFMLRHMTIKNRFTDYVVSVDNAVATYRMLAGTKYPYDEARYRAVFTQAIDVRKGQNPRARFQQYCAIAASGSRLNELKQIKAPALVLHGTADPLVPPIHAQIYAPLIPDIRLVWLEGVGHELPVPVLPEVTAEILALLQAAKVT